MTNLANKYWEERFTIGTAHHSSQNGEISRDFFQNIKPSFDDLFKSSDTIIEIGCGTGELSRMISDRYGKKVVGTDLSQSGIDFANKNHANDLTTYKATDI